MAVVDDSDAVSRFEAALAAHRRLNAREVVGLGSFQRRPLRVGQGVLARVEAAVRREGRLEAAHGIGVVDDCHFQIDYGRARRGDGSCCCRRALGVARRLPFHKFGPCAARLDLGNARLVS